jgi:hypothetical protein
MASPFLDLPAELRDKVYEYLTPIYCYTKECIGFLLSCKQVYREYEARASRSMKSLVSTVASGWSSIYHIQIHINPVATIAAQQWMSILLPRSRYPGTENFGNCSPGLPSCLEPVLLLHLEQLEFGLYTDNEAIDMPMYSCRDMDPPPGGPFPWPYVLIRNLGQLLDGMSFEDTTADCSRSIRTRRLILYLGNQITIYGKMRFCGQLQNYGPLTYFSIFSFEDYNVSLVRRPDLEDSNFIFGSSTNYE